MRPDWEAIVAGSRVAGGHGTSPVVAGHDRARAGLARQGLRVADRLDPGGEVLVLQHGGEAPSAQLLGVLAERGIEPVVRDVTCAADLPAYRPVQAVIVVGWPRADEAAAAGYLEAEAGWLRRVDRAGATILGLGHGARVLALALGGGLREAERPIRGWVMVDTSLPHVIATGPWLTWQYDIISLPAGARVLAHNRLGAQAFSLGRHLGVQFHPEATPAMAASWAARHDVPVDVQGLLGATGHDVAADALRTRRLLAMIANLV